MKNTTSLHNSMALSMLIFVLNSCLPAPADSFEGNLNIKATWLHSKSVGSSVVKETFSPFVDWTHTSGTSTNQMNVIVRETVALTNAQTRILNLSGGVSDSFGDVTTFTTVRFLGLTCPSTNIDPVSIGGAATNAWAAWCGATNQTLTVRPGGAAILLAPDLTGYPVTTNACNLLITNTGTNANSYSIYIGGAE